VGGSPDHFGTPVREFHEHNLKRQKFWPHALITSSTHDSKRGEDVRARINVLSEIPEEWKRRITRWSRMNRKCRVPVDGAYAPDANEEYFLYQTLVGAWPLTGREEPPYGEFVGRIREYMLKALREAKVNTSWINPHLAYEQAFAGFLDAILARGKKNAFLDDFEDFHAKIAYCGMINSLSQTLLKTLSPGVPDFFQGTETWSFTLVDPDNRRPVDYGLRRAMLADLERLEKGSDPRDVALRLFDTWRDGRIKMYVTAKSLKFRKDRRDALSRLRYIPLEAEGARASNVCAFARRTHGFPFIVAVPRLLMGLLGEGESAGLRPDVWDGSFLPVPTPPEAAYENAFTGEVIRPVEHRKAPALPLAEVFGGFPVALLSGVERTGL
jgi:(1->4)-alpha-D-glucan 1-alpha-D-glucosylmutase